MNKWLDFVAVVASFSTCIGFVGLFIKLGREKGAMDITVKEMRKDISSNETKLVTLDARVTQMQIENTKGVNIMENKELKAKTVSLIAKMTAGAVLLIGATLKWLGIFSNCEISELCTVAGTLVALFVTVDANIALDKFSKKE